MTDLPPTEFSNAMNRVGRPVGLDYRTRPEWKIFLAGMMAERQRQHEELTAAKERILRLQSDIEDQQELMEMLENECEGG